MVPERVRKLHEHPIPNRRTSTYENVSPRLVSQSYELRT